MKKIFYAVVCGFIIFNSLSFVLAADKEKNAVTYSAKEIKKKLKDGIVVVSTSKEEVEKIKKEIKDLPKKNKRNIIELYLKRAEYYKLQSNAATYPANRKSHKRLAKIMAGIAHDCSDEFVLLKEQSEQMLKSLK